MTQLLKQFTVEQIKVLFASYEQGHLSRDEIENTLGINKTRFLHFLNNTTIIQMHFPLKTIEQTNHGWESKPKKKFAMSYSVRKN